MQSGHTDILTLPCGMRLFCRQTQMQVEYFGIAVNAGSRDERPGMEGLAHFVEHTIFKGTEHRRSFHIINRMETVGGDLNAFTSKEETNVYSVFPAGNLARAAELIADLILNSRFPADEIGREREVVRDEIDSYLDTPSEAVYDEFEDLFFKGNGLGHNILGTTHSIDAFTPEVCRRYLTDNFGADRMVAYYMGPEDPQRVAKTVGRYFGQLAMSKIQLDRRKPDILPAFDIRRDSDTHQCHTVIGVPIPGILSEDNPAIQLVINILGGPGMNSRLNVSLRERRGLVYTVEASTTLFSDCGLMCIYFGCDPDDRQRCLDLVWRELASLSAKPMTLRALEAAKRQYQGQMLVASENAEQVILSAGRSLLLTGRVKSLAEIQQSVAGISLDDIARTAAMLSPDRCSVLSIG